MRKCNCTHFASEILRSTSPLTLQSQDWQQFIKSKDYTLFLANFPDLPPPKVDKARMLTYNNTIKQALFIPIVFEPGKKKVAIISFFDLLQFNFYSLVLISEGNLENLVELSGDLNMTTVSKSPIFSGSFSSNRFVTVTNVNPINPGETPFSDCVTNSFIEIGQNGYASIICALNPEECVVGVILHCVLATL